MIVVKVELWSAITGQKSEIARMAIDNIGGTAQRGDYRCRTMRGRSAEQLERAMRQAPQREGRVLGHARLREHVWHLVAKALSGMGYGHHPKVKNEMSRYFNLTIKVDVTPGALIPDAMADLQALADKTGCRAETVANGVTCVAVPFGSAAILAQRQHEAQSNPLARKLVSSRD